MFEKIDKKHTGKFTQTFQKIKILEGVGLILIGFLDYLIESFSEEKNDLIAPHELTDEDREI